MVYRSGDKAEMPREAVKSGYRPTTRHRHMEILPKTANPEHMKTNADVDFD